MAAPRRRCRTGLRCAHLVATRLGAIRAAPDKRPLVASSPWLVVAPTPATSTATSTQRLGPRARQSPTCDRSGGGLVAPVGQCEAGRRSPESGVTLCLESSCNLRKRTRALH